MQNSSHIVPRLCQCVDAGELDIPELPFELEVGEVDHFSLSKILMSGQPFRWRRLDDGADDAYCRIFMPVAGFHAIAEQQGGHLRIRHDCPNDGMWKTYLALDRDYGQVIAELDGLGSSLVAQALAFSDGVRVLNQPFWECCITFLCSQNNNIAKITGSIEKICSGVDKPFPSPEELLEKLETEDCSLGYRKTYIRSFAEAFLRGELDDVEALSVLARGEGQDWLEKPAYSEMSGRLRQYAGIGPKVAACICLFSLGYDEAVPRDVWIKRAEELGVIWHPELGGIQQQFVFFQMSN